MPWTPPCARPSAGSSPRWPASTSPTTRCACWTPPRAPAPSPGSSSTPPTATASGRPSACPRTSSRRRGRLCPIRSCTASCCTMTGLPPASPMPPSAEETARPVTQPDYVPLKAGDRIRPVERLPPSGAWRADRPADLDRPGMPTGPRLGSHGPDLGYGIKLARMLVDRVRLTDGETMDDAVAGAFATGSKRSSLFGRAPVIYDFELAYTLWGFFDGAPADLVAF